MSSGSFKEFMAALRTAGTPELAEQCAAAGVTGPCFGVPPAAIAAIAGGAAPDQPLALQLFETGVHDARLLATKLADPAKFTAANCDRWVKACQEPRLSRAVAALIAATLHAEKKSDVWRTAKRPWKAACGWWIVQRLAEPDAALHAWLKGRVGEGRRVVRAAPEPVRGAICDALAAIGGHRPELRDQVLGVAKKLKLRAVTEGVEALVAAWEAQA